MNVPLIFPFFLALTAALCGSVFMPHIRLIAFSPFLALLYTRTAFIPSLWLAALCGLIIDLLSSEFRFGLHSLGYALTTVVMYKQKRHFFEDKLFTLALFTTLTSCAMTVIQLFLIAVFDRAVPITAKLIISDLLVMPIADGAYAFIWFSCPMLLYAHIKKVGWQAFWDKLWRSLSRQQEPSNK